MSDGSRDWMVPTDAPFEYWFAACILYCADNKLGSPEYSWSLKHPGVWHELFSAGLTPIEAAHSQFARQ
jgi:hypothetical protein